MNNAFFKRSVQNKVHIFCTDAFDSIYFGLDKWFLYNENEDNDKRIKQY